ncbi:MAG: secretion system protein [Thaumarchaeota archaeon]|nr:MAG: secretion system protein [Nitrososphaerota archaeon]
MLSSLKNMEKADAQKKQAQKLERELPYFITIVSLLASSGFGPYSIFQKFREIDLLPLVKTESIKILKRIELLGMDPLDAIGQAKDKQGSRLFGEFLSGYVSAIQSGGNVINYLKTKMESSFVSLESKEKLGVEKISGIIHAWLTMQIVILSVFILLSAIGSNPIGGTSGAQTQSDPPYPLLIFAPAMSGMFLLIVKNMVKSNIPELQFKKIIMVGAPVILIVTILILTGALSNLHIDPYLLGIAIIRKIYALSLDAETATPQILRDITEARKAGIGPEKCIIRACKRKDFKLFNTLANAISNKLEWGVGLHDIYDSLRQELRNFQVLVSFKILFEIIASGGGNVDSLDSLADTSEKIYNIEKHKREELKVYVMVGFMLITVTGLTTLLTIDSFAAINEQKDLKKENGPATPNLFLEKVGLAIVVQAWISGLFIGKITKGVYSGGFMYSILLVIIAMISFALIQLHIVNFSSFLTPHSTPSPS